MPMILAPTLPPRSPAFSASGHDRCRRRSLKLVSITELVDTSHHRRKNRTVPHPAKPRKAAHTGGRPFTPMTVLAFATLRTYQITESSGVFTLVRNFGSSLFISVAV